MLMSPLLFNWAGGKTRHAGQIEEGSQPLPISCCSFPSQAMGTYHQHSGALARSLFWQSITDCADELDRRIFGSKQATIWL